MNLTFGWRLPRISTLLVCFVRVSVRLRFGFGWEGRVFGVEFVWGDGLLDRERELGGFLDAVCNMNVEVQVTVP
jgi:hypothetical protein